ncbi:Glycerol-3-phosphate dehydrogenase [hydrothermal vent metagenome]|uniref:Glycerol-3-phosphate dehydrogenase n=1 Tax=hydrothermal vent metagenome TaxID=652676 RepID=A0A1W1EEA7_9ZZZZ
MGKDIYDIIVIGGGATGAGIVLDASSRGYKVLLLEKYDFAEGTSSRSTKLVHGGVRYLEKAVKRLDKKQFDLVKEGLYERDTLIANAPHIAGKQALTTPLYSWFQLPYMYAGLFLYDIISGKHRIGRSSIVSKQYMLDTYPNIQKKGLKGGVKYYDGTFNDSRLNIALLQSARKRGAECKNYKEMKEIIKENGKAVGVKYVDTIDKSEGEAFASVIINATGPCTDVIRRIDDEKSADILELSTGIHIVLDKKYLPKPEGIMIPKTEDGRVLFILPWMGKCLVGTTDDSAKLVDRPKVTDAEIKYILKHLDIYFDLKIDESEVLSSWSGLRPLLKAKEGESTENLVRDFDMSTSNSGVVTVVGGKWTTYRKMAEDTIDYVISNEKLESKKCITKNLKVVGSENFSDNLTIDSIDKDISDHLVSMYGDKANDVLKVQDGQCKKLHDNYSYIEAEVIYTVRDEFVKRAIDFLVRRSCIALIDRKAAKDMLEKVLELMSIELQWDNDKIEQERAYTLNLLNNSI